MFSGKQPGFGCRLSVAALINLLPGDLSEAKTPRSRPCSGTKGIHIVQDCGPRARKRTQAPAKNRCSRRLDLIGISGSAARRRRIRLLPIPAARLPGPDPALQRGEETACRHRRSRVAATSRGRKAGTWAEARTAAAFPQCTRSIVSCGHVEMQRLPFLIEGRRFFVICRLQVIPPGSEQLARTLGVLTGHKHFDARASRVRTQDFRVSIDDLCTDTRLAEKPGNHLRLGGSRATRRNDRFGRGRLSIRNNAKGKRAVRPFRRCFPGHVQDRQRSVRRGFVRYRGWLGRIGAAHGLLVYNACSVHQRCKDVLDRKPVRRGADRHQPGLRHQLGAEEQPLADDVRAGLLRDRDDGGRRAAGSTWTASVPARSAPRRARRT